jgi:predicted kinase
MRVILLRGISGSGKSTLANKLALETPNTVICTADDYFMVDGAYKFDRNKLGEAHQACYQKFFVEITKGTDLVIVANTNTTTKELVNYVGICEDAGVPFEIITVNCPVEVAIQRNAHSVPKKTILRQYDNLIRVQFPKSWPVRTIDLGAIETIDFDSDPMYKHFKE